jgi:hypothetical protein
MVILNGGVIENILRNIKHSCGYFCMQNVHSARLPAVELAETPADGLAAHKSPPAISVDSPPRKKEITFSEPLRQQYFLARQSQNFLSIDRTNSDSCSSISSL